MSVMRRRYRLTGTIMMMGFSLCLAQRPRLTADDLAGRRVLWLGDSITQAGDYVSFTEYYLERQRPKERFDFISIGLASETADCLTEAQHPFPRPCVQERLGRALTEIKPQVVVICYGMNDGIYHPQSEERMMAFEAGIEKISAAVKAAGAELIVLTPPPFDAVLAKTVNHVPDAEYSYMHVYQGYDSVLEEFARWELGLPRSTAAAVIDLHGPMDAYLKERRKHDPRFSFGQKDGIHPDPSGHLMMARLVVRRLGLNLPEVSLNTELQRVEDDPMFALVKKAREERSEAWLPYVGYKRNGYFKTDSVVMAEKDVAALQIRIDALRRQ